MTLNSGIKDSFKKFSLLFRHAEMVFVIVWFFGHFTLEYVPSMNSIWIITPAGLFHVWVTNFNTFFIFFKLSILTWNNVIWVSLFAIFFNEAQHVIETSTMGYVPVFYEVINLFIKPQNVLLMLFLCILERLYLIIFFFNGLLMLPLDLLHSCIKPTWYYVLQDVLFKCLVFVFSRVYSDIKGTSQ